MSERLWLLLLSLLPDVGRGTLRHLLERQQVHRLTPADLLALPDETLQEEYRLPKRALDALRANYPQLIAEAERLEAHLTRCGVRWLSFQHASYPCRLEQMQEPPALLFAYGNYDLLAGNTVALLASHTISKRGLEVLEQILGVFLEQDWVPLVSQNQPAYQRALLGTVRKAKPYVLVLDRGLLKVFGDDLRKEPLASARIWRAEFDPQRALAISPFRPRDGWITGNSRYRDQLIAYLADAVIVVEARPDGYITQLATELLQKGMEVRVYARELDRMPGNRQLLSAGAIPLE